MNKKDISDWESLFDAEPTKKELRADGAGVSDTFKHDSALFTAREAHDLPWLNRPEVEYLTDEIKAIIYNRDLDDSGLSGDDVNRRLREGRMGIKAPSSDWEANKGKVIRCIYPGQTFSRKPSAADVFMNAPVAWAG